MVGFHVHSIRVQFAWYPWYQSSSVPLECLLSEVVEAFVLSGTIGRLPMNTPEFNQHDYDIVMTLVRS
jgi:hypothetical protein